MTYLRNLWGALVRDGADLDITENTFLDGKPGMTISMRCAIANHAGATWAAVACFLLNFVQWRHCPKQLAGVGMSLCNYVRAILALIGVPVLLIAGAYYLARLIVLAL